jgi:hypothetical protein
VIRTLHQILFEKNKVCTVARKERSLVGLVEKLAEGTTWKTQAWIKKNII